MKPDIRGLVGLVALVMAAGLLVMGCGSDDGTTTEAQTTPGKGAGPKTVEIKMDDFFFVPKNASATAGQTTIEAPNDGSVEHELVLFKTNLNPAKLPTADGLVDEEKMEEVAQEAGEIPDVEVGDTKSQDFKLTPGKYVMFCNLPGHYAQGMYGTLTVTK